MKKKNVDKTRRIWTGLGGEEEMIKKMNEVISVGQWTSLDLSGKLMNMEWDRRKR